MKFIKLLLIIIFFSLILIFLNYQGWLVKPKSMILGFFSPTQNFAHSATGKIWRFFDLIAFIPKLNRENIELKKQNQELLARLIEIQEIKYENKQLRDQLNTIDSGEKGEKDKKKLLLAEIIGQGELILINQGKNQGVQIGMTAIASGDILVGKVIEVLDSVSKIQPIMFSKEPVNVIIQDSRTHGVINSKHGTSLFIEFIPGDLEINQGDIVITSSLGGQFQQGLIIGEIFDIQESSSNLEQTALINPLINLKNLEKIFVILE